MIGETIPSSECQVFGAAVFRSFFLFFSSKRDGRPKRQRDHKSQQANHFCKHSFHTNDFHFDNKTMALSKESNIIRASEKKAQAKEVILGIVVDIISLGAVCFLSYGLSRYLSSKIQQPNLSRHSNQEAKDRLMNMLMEREVAEAEEEEEDGYVDVEAIREKVRRKITTTLELNEYETAIAEDVIDPNDITISFKDVGGIDDIKAELWDLVCLPILRPDLFQSESGLVSPPRGILLYGAPGTGKTMLAKAIAKESGATFVNVRLSNIMDKWFGESNKLVSATFSLARKLAPSVIFIDEIDTFLNQRDSSEGSATTSMKSEFLTLWDGMLSGRFVSNLFRYYYM